MNSFGGPTDRSRNRPHSNLNALRVSVLCLFGLLTARLVYLQLVNGASYAEQSRNNHLAQETVAAPRGLIYDRNGTPLVDNVPDYTAQLIPDLLPPSPSARYTIYRSLEQILGIPALEIQTRVVQAEANNTGGSAIDLKDHLTQPEALELDGTTTNMPGVSLVVSPGRYYPAGTDFSNILGYIGPQSAGSAAQYAREGYSANEPVGLTGLEKMYQKSLRGTPGVTVDEQNAAGRLIQPIRSVAPVPGNSLKLSIDKGLQDFVAQTLESSMNYGNNAFSSETARVAAAVVMSPQTGAVYALVSVPSYNNNIFSNLQANAAEYAKLANDTVHSPLLDHALAAAAPGSTFKMITASAGLQNGTVTPHTSRTINSTILPIKGVNGQIYNLYDWETHGTIDLYQAIAQSSDIYFYGVSCGLPPTQGLPGMQGLSSNSDTGAVILGQYARSFGLGLPTGIDLPGEDPGNVPSPAQKLITHNGLPWVYFDTCYMGIGQGDVLATPLQMARVTAAVANGGKLVTPHVVDQILSPSGKLIQNVTGGSKQVPVSPQNLAVVKEGMHLCVQSPSGACTTARAAGIDMSGKTGTAEFNDSLDGGKLREHAWFTGFAPYNNPQVVITVYFDLGWGGARAAPVASKIATYFFQHVKLNQ